MTTTSPDAHTDRAFFGQPPSGVTVIAAQTDDGVRGLVVGTFGSVSLDPPLVSFMVDTGSRSWAAVRDAGVFSGSILAHDQRGLSLSQRLAGAQAPAHPVPREHGDDRWAAFRSGWPTSRPENVHGSACHSSIA